MDGKSFLAKVQLTAIENKKIAGIISMTAPREAHSEF